MEEKVKEKKVAATEVAEEVKDVEVGCVNGGQGVATYEDKEDDVVLERILGPRGKK